MAVLRFTMSGRRFVFDGGRPLTGGELLAVESEMGLDAETVADDLKGGRHSLRNLMVFAFLAARREQPGIRWAEFGETIEPHTFEVIPADPEPAPVPDPQPSVSPTVAALVAKAAEPEPVTA